MKEGTSCSGKVEERTNKCGERLQLKKSKRLGEGEGNTEKTQKERSIDSVSNNIFSHLCGLLTLHSSTAGAVCYINSSSHITITVIGPSLGIL